MVNIYKSNWFWGLFASVIILFALTIFSNWMVLGCVWFSVFFISRFSKLEAQLPSREHKLYLITAFIFPIIETWINWVINKNILPNFLIGLNRLEHFCSSVGVVIILLPIYINIWHRLKPWQNLVFILGLICLIGNLNEFFEYYLRVCCKFVSDEKFIFYYEDTIYDMGVNLIGGLAGFIIVKLNIKSS